MDRRPSCDEVRVLASERRHGRAPEVAEHVAGCAACRVELARLDELLDLVSSTAEVDPPAALDRRVRSLLAEPAAALRPVLRPALAISLAAAALLSFGLALTTFLAEAGAAGQAPLIASTVIWIYLAFSSTASLPILLNRRMRVREVSG